MEEEKKTPRRMTAAAALCVLAAFLLLAALLLGVDERHVNFYLQDGAEITVPLGAPYKEPGVRACPAGRLTGESPEELAVRVEGEVDTGALGDYELRYVASTLFHRYSTTRLVHVTDQTPPQITLLRNDSYMPNWLEGYREEGYAAWDEVDGDLTERVTVERDGDCCVYTVADGAGNTARAVRQIPYSIGCPEIRLNGGEALEIDAAFTFTDPGFTCTDARGNDLSARVTVEGEVDPLTAGEYVLRYRIENALGECVERTRTVTVRPLRNPDTIDPEGKLIYLSFDDGPSENTDRLLDVLARYNVKASFFVTNLYPDYVNCIGRAFREGHTIGVHSASHSYRGIYRSEEAYLADFEAMQEIIRAQTGQESRIFRFPGGSSNTVSRFNRGIMTRLASVMEEKGYVYYDWNVSAGDAGGAKSAGEVFQNIVDGCSGRRVSIVLQHDSKPFSVDAVERVIVWGLTNGFQFAALDETVEPVHHRIVN